MSATTSAAERADARTRRIPRSATFGNPDGPAVAVLGGISAGRHVCNVDDSAGWWSDIAGDGCALDTRRLRIVGMDWIGSGLTERDTAQDVSTFDQARALAATLDALAIARLHALAGASYGGMVALAFAALYPDRVSRLVILGAAHCPHPMAAAVRIVQRRIIALATTAGRAADGVALARALAMTTYRTHDEFGARFGGPADVEQWLDYHGDRFAASWTAARYETLSRSIDTHRVDPARIRTPVTLVSFTGDAIAPPSQLRALAEQLAGPVTLHEIETQYGHDAFLKETGVVARLLAQSLELETLT
ncbi:MAG TPA: homoserine O-succinyltransferase [Longimicrobiales bacterium]